MRDYYDETLLYCLDDGSALLDGPASADPQATAIMSEPKSVRSGASLGETATRILREPSHDFELDDDDSHRSRRHDSKRTSLTIGAVGILLVTVLGIGSYLYYGRETNKPIESVAVLPFQNRSIEPDTEYLSDGLAESLIYRLSQLPGLKVTPTSTVFRYKGNNTDPIEIGRELGVHAVLSGRIVQRGDNLTISVDLVDITGNKLLWGEQYDRKTADLLATQREIAREIVDTLKIKVTGDAKGLTKNYTESSEAYQLYLRGRYHWNKRNPESIRKAIEYLNQAIEKDPGFALAYAGLADCYVVPALGMAPKDAMPKAKAAAIRALEIDDTLAEAHTSLGRVLQVYDWNWKEAEREFKRAIELNPRYPVAHQWYGGYLERIGRAEESILERKLALELDPFSVITNFELGQAYYFARDYDKAIEQYKKTLELDPNFPAALQYLPLVYVQKGMHAEALQALENIEAAPESSGITAAAVPGYVHAASGRIKEARIMVEELKRVREQRYVSEVSIAQIYTALGEKDEAFAWLEKAYEERAFQMQYLKVEPRWDSLRADPRFADLLRRVGLQESN